MVQLAPSDHDRPDRSIADRGNSCEMGGNAARCPPWVSCSDEMPSSRSLPLMLAHDMARPYKCSHIRFDDLVLESPRIPHIPCPLTSSAARPLGLILAQSSTRIPLKPVHARLNLL